MPSLMATSLRWRTHSARTNNEKARQGSFQNFFQYLCKISQNAKCFSYIHIVGFKKCAYLTSCLYVASRW